MRSDSSDTIVKLGKSTIVVQRGRHTARLTIRTASLVVTSGRQPMHLVLEGPSGSVRLQLSRIAFWRLTGQFYERSILADVRPPRRTLSRSNE